MRLLTDGDGRALPEGRSEDLLMVLMRAQGYTDMRQGSVCALLEKIQKYGIIKKIVPKVSCLSCLLCLRSFAYASSSHPRRAH